MKKEVITFFLRGEHNAIKTGTVRKETSCVIICHASFVSLDHNVPIISKTKTEEMQIAGMIFLEKPLKLSFHKTKHKNIPIIIKPLATLATKGE